MWHDLYFSKKEEGLDKVPATTENCVIVGGGDWNCEKLCDIL